MDKSGKMRTFIAVEIDPQVKENLKRMVHQFKKVSSKVKWVKPTAMHLTLKFLGNVNSTKADQVIKIMDKITQKYPPFDLFCSGIGTFPLKTRKPKIIWAGIKESSTLKDIYLEIENELERIGFSKEKRSFHPHLTLGRVKKKAAVQNLLPELKKNEKMDFGKSKIKGVILFKSTLSPQGAVYDKLHESLLK